MRSLARFSIQDIIEIFRSPKMQGLQQYKSWFLPDNMLALVITFNHLSHPAMLSDFGQISIVARLLFEYVVM
jgi:hypothetical protein